MTEAFQTPNQGGHHKESFLNRLRAEIHDFVHVQQYAHELMIEKARGVERHSDGFFTAIPTDRVLGVNPPDSVSDFPEHDPNAFSQEELEGALSLLDAFLGDAKPRLTHEFVSFAARSQVFDRIRSGQTIIIPSNHSVFQDQGYHLGLMHLAAKSVGGVDRFDNHATLVLGKTLGYLEVAGMNVIDDILRKAGSVVKTFPVSGGETLRDAVFTDDDMNLALSAYQKHCNRQAREAIQRKVEDNKGGVIFLAAGATPDVPNESGDTFMSIFDKSTVKLLHDAMAAGAIVAPLFGDYEMGGTNYAKFADKMLTIEDLPEPDDVHHIGHVIAAIGQRVRAENPNDPRMQGNIYYAPKI